MSFENIPKEMKEAPRWCLRKDKVPYSVSGRPAKPNDLNTFSSFGEVIEALEGAGENGYDGIGFLLGGGWIGVDFDHCLDKTAGLDPRVKSWVQRFDSYAEKSPSETGLHIITKGLLTDGSVKRDWCEMYDKDRYFTVTGNVYGEYRPVRVAQEAISALRQELAPPAEEPAPQLPQREGYSIPPLADSEILETAFRAKNGDAIQKLYSGDWSGYKSQSEADIALCNYLAFYTKDAQQLDRLFRASGLMRDKWDHKHGKETYGEMTVRKAIDLTRESYTPRATAAQDFEGITPEVTCSLEDLRPEKRYRLSDIGNGALFADYFKDRARYSQDRKKWFVYNGKVWKADDGGLMAMELCKRLANRLLVYALNIQDEQERAAYLKHVQKWQLRKNRETILKDAQSVYPVDMQEFDKDPLLFNCQNGTLDLRNRFFRPHSAGDMLTTISGVTYDPEARSPRWEKFMDEVMEGDRERIVFLQKALGYALTGDTELECLFFLYGPTTRNGKGTTMETYKTLVGDYGTTAEARTFALRKNTDSRAPSEDLASLAGKRFISISEPDKAMSLDVAAVKMFTGRDTLRARFLNEGGFNFKPQGKVFINTNYLPNVSDVTLFSSDRVKIIPFERHFSPKEQDRGLKDELARPENLSGILNWCLDGLWLMRETGLDSPASVREATEEYRIQSDKIGRFLSDEFERTFDGETTTAAAYERYKIWCANNGHHPENMTNFKAQLISVATVKRKLSQSDGQKRTVILGYSLKPGQGRTGFYG